MSRSKSAANLQTSLFDEATLAAGVDRQVADVPAIPPAGDQDGRSTAVWRQWLSSMASDAESALAAAIAYREMDSAGREQWLSSLEFDAPEVDVPPVALYAPLLAVEQDPARRERLIFALGDTGSPNSEALVGLSPERAFLGKTSDGVWVWVIATPLYLDFVQVLACGVKDGIFQWVRHDPIVGPVGIPTVGQMLEGAKLELAPMKSVVDELAKAVLSHRRAGHELPEGLMILSDLLGPLGP